MHPTRALVHIDPTAPDQKSQIDGLKRISLLFDEIHYKLATGWQIKDEAAADPRRYKRTPEGHFVPSRQFRPPDLLRDVSPTFVLDLPSLGTELKETLEALEKAGIARQVSEELVKRSDPTNRMGHLREVFIGADYADEEFARLSGDHKDISFTFGRFGLAPDSNEDDLTELHYIEFPPSFLDSITITETLYLSHLTFSNSVFLRPHFRAELDHRFRQFRDGVKTLKDIAPDVAASLRLNAHFGEVAFNVANAVVSSRLLETKSIEELLAFRAETNDSRQRFISAGLSEIDEMVSENAWSPMAKEELNRYVQKKLTGDILAYNDITREIYEKLFGKFRVKLAGVSSAAVLNTAATSHIGGLLGSVIPNASGVSLLMIAALAIAPSIAKDLEEAIAEARKARRSSIAYIARLSKFT